MFVLIVDVGLECDVVNLVVSVSASSRDDTLKINAVGVDIKLNV